MLGNQMPEKKMPKNKMSEINDRVTLEEIQKWQKKLEPMLPNLEENEFTTNIKAYYSDSSHFLENGDYVRAFEAIVWAWAWYEIGRDYIFSLQSAPSEGGQSSQNTRP